MSDNKYKIKLRKGVPADQVETTSIPAIQRIMDDAVSIISEQVKRLHIKSYQGIALDANESNILQKYIQMVVSIQRELREAEKDGEALKKLKSMSDAELLEYAQSLIEAKK